MDLPLPLLSGVTVLVACCGYWALRRWRHWPSSPLTIAAILMCGWLILDLRWQWNLGSDALASWINFAGKDLSSKRLAGVDEELEKIAIDVRGFLTKGARVFVIAQDPVTTGRLAYLLLPATIYYNTAQTSLPAPEQFKPGDLMLVHRKPGIRYSPDRKEFLWDNQFRVRAEIIYFDKGGTVLARIL